MKLGKTYCLLEEVIYDIHLAIPHISSWLCWDHLFKNYKVEGVD